MLRDTRLSDSYVCKGFPSLRPLAHRLRPFILLPFRWSVRCMHQQALWKWRLNRVKLSRIWIVVSFFWLIWHQIEFRSVSNQLEKFNCNPNLVLFQQNSGSVSLCVCSQTVSYLSNLWNYECLIETNQIWKINLIHLTCEMGLREQKSGGVRSIIGFPKFDWTFCI